MKSTYDNDELFDIERTLVETIASSLNERMTGLSSNELYSRQDYNAQHELWGKHFSESTKGAMLATSWIASLGYASPIQPITHRFRDFLLQFTTFSDFTKPFTLLLLFVVVGSK